MQVVLRTVTFLDHILRNLDSDRPCTSCPWGGSLCTSSLHLGKMIKSTSETTSWFLSEQHALGDTLVLQVPYTGTTGGAGKGVK